MSIIRIQKVWRFGPFRANLTKSGIGLSIGIAGARYTLGGIGRRKRRRGFRTRHGLLQILFLGKK